MWRDLILRSLASTSTHNDNNNNIYQLLAVYYNTCECVWTKTFHTVTLQWRRETLAHTGNQHYTLHTARCNSSVDNGHGVQPKCGVQTKKCEVQNGKKRSPTSGTLTVLQIKGWLCHSGDFHLQFFVSFWELRLYPGETTGGDFHPQTPHLWSPKMLTLLWHTVEACNSRLKGCTKSKFRVQLPHHSCTSQQHFEIKRLKVTAPNIT